MASVFLSYVRADEPRARSIALALEKAGHSVWWDRHITGGAQYSKEIEQALKSADVVVVLWSEQSVDSAWVRDEAAAGRDSGHLVPVRLDGAEPPLGFRQYQTIDMSSGASRVRSPQFRMLLQAVQTVSGNTAAIQAPRKRDRTRPLLNRSLLIALAGALLSVAALYQLWSSLSPKSAVPVVAVTGADRSPTAAAMARDLLVKLGSLQSVKAEAVELTEQPRDRDADLTFTVGGSSERQASRASLALLDGPTRSLLWSQDFEAPNDQRADLQQQVAFTAGRALECALEALAGERRGLKRPLVKLYLNGCAAIGEVPPRDLMPIFRQVTAEAPRFEGGWAKLILVEILASINTPADPALLRIVRQHIVDARKVNPDLAEAYLAEALLLAPNDYAGGFRLVDLAIERNPNQPEPFNARAQYLRAVGRMNEAAESVRRASELDPLSALTRANYIGNLTLAGQFEKARYELEVAERLWPGSSRIRDARFTMQLRYGDPVDALRLSRLGASSPAPEVTESFLRARIEPTPDNIEAAVRQARSLFARDPARIPTLALTLGAFDREEELFPILLSAPRQTLFDVNRQLFNPSLRELRQDPRFMLIAKRLGLVTYWQKSGKWPDFCFEADLPYDCKAEAAKLAA